MPALHAMPAHAGQAWQAGKDGVGDGWCGLRPAVLRSQLKALAQTEMGEVEW